VKARANSNEPLIDCSELHHDSQDLFGFLTDEFGVSDQALGGADGVESSRRHLQTPGHVA
jgi:hypothetical protein